MLHSTRGRVSKPSTTTRLSADRLLFLSYYLVDKHAHILVISLPNCQELVHISIHKCIPI